MGNQAALSSRLGRQDLWTDGTAFFLDFKPADQLAAAANAARPAGSASLRDRPATAETSFQTGPAARDVG